METGLFFTNNTLQSFVNLIKSHGIPTLTSPARIWNLEAGIYRIPKNCQILYNGKTASNYTIIKSETFMVVSGTNPTGNKTFYIFDSPSSTTRQILGGYTNSSTGAISSFGFNNQYALANSVLSKTNTTVYTPSSDYNPSTKKYVDDSIQSAILSSGGSGGPNIIYANSSTEPFVFLDQNPGLYILSNISQFYYKVKTDDTTSSYRFDGNKNIIFILYKTKVDESTTSLSDFARIYNLNPSGPSIRYLQLNLVSGSSSYTSNGGIIITQSDNQTISGQKRFVTLPITTIVPTNDNELVNKKYVDDKIAEVLANING